MTGFTAADVTVTNGTLSGFASDADAAADTVWTATVTPDGTGDLTVEVAADAVADAYGNAGPAQSASETATWDATRPKVTIAGHPESFTFPAALSMTFTFDEAVTGFAAADVTVTNGTLSGFANDAGAAADTVWTATVKPDGTGDLTVEVAADAVADGHGNTGPETDAAVTATYVAPVYDLRVATDVEALRASWDEIAGADKYRVQWKSGTQAWSTSERRHEIDAPETTYLIESLSAGTRYAVRVTATKSGADDAEPSAEVEGVPVSNLVPAFLEGETARREVAEDAAAGDDVGLAVTAADSEGETLTYALSGTGHENFAIDGSGQITVASGATLDYETVSSYTLTAAVHDGKDDANAVEGTPSVDDSIEVTITVTNVDEAGSVTFGAETPELGVAFTASVEDPDGSVSAVTWQWSRTDSRGVTAEISGATSASYTPVASDVGTWLVATASYTDGHGSGKSASAESENATTARAPAKPTGLTATAENEQVRLAWADPNDATITGYQYRQKAGGGNYGAWTDIPDSAAGEANATSYTVKRLKNGTAYTFRIRAVNAAGNGPPSDEAGPATPTSSAATTFWSATLTVDEANEYYGCDNEDEDQADCSDSSVLSNDEFVHDGTTYTVGRFYWSEVDQELVLAFDGKTGAAAKAALGSLTLHLGSHSLAVSAASASSTALVWNFNPSPAWSDGDKVTVRLRMPATRADTTAPTVTAGSTGYYGDAALQNALTGPLKAGADVYTKVTFSEDMKHVKSDRATARPELFYRIGGTDARYHVLDHGDTLASGDCKPNDASETDEYVCRYTVGGSDNGAFTVKAGTNSADKADNALAAAYTHATTLTLDTTAPAAPVDLAATAGNAQVRLTWSDPSPEDASIAKWQVRQKSTGSYGKWQDVSGGAKARAHTVTSLRNGTAYTFEVRAVDTAANEGEAGAAGPATPAAPPMGPTVWSATLTVSESGEFYGCDNTDQDQDDCSDSAVLSDDDFTYGGTTYSVNGLYWQEDIDLLLLDFGLSVQETRAARAALGALTLNVDGDALAFSDSTHQAGTKEISWLFDPTTDWTDGLRVSLSLTGPATGPVVTGALEVTSDPGSDDTYIRGDSLAVTVTFDKAIVVTGTPQLTIKVGSADRTASCAAHGSDDTKLVCTYTVAAGDEDADGVSVAANQLSLPSGASIKDASDVDATLIHDALAAQSGHKVDTTVPTIPAAPSITSDPGDDDTYAAGDEIEITVTFSEPVTVTGTPRLTLAVGDGTPRAAYQSGSGTAALIFSYTVAAGDEDTDGIAIGEDAISLAPSVTIADGHGHNANTAHGALAAQSGHKVDGVKPAKPSALALATGTTSPGTDATPEIEVTVTEQGGKVRLYYESDCLADFPASAETDVTDTEAPFTVTVTAGELTSETTYGFYARHADTVGNWSDCSTANATYQYATVPTVTADSTGYFGDTALQNALTGPLKAGADIYTKVTFSEDMKHVKGDDAAARPELFYRIGTTDTQYDIVDNGDTLASGDCKPTDTTETDEYVCLYTVGPSDSGAFTVKAGTNSVDEADNALAAAYTHATTLTLDTTAPAAPVDLAAAAGNAEVRLTWGDPSPADAGIATWQVRQKSTGSYGNWQDVSGGAAARAHAVTSLDNGTAYTFQVRAVDTAANEGAAGTAGPVTPSAVGPRVTGAPAITSQAYPQAYTTGDVLEVTVTFDKAIVVTGTPRLTIKVGTADRTASCAAHESDNRKLVCSYAVAAGDEDTDGVSVEANKLSLPSGASIRDVSDLDATLTHEALAAQSTYKVDARAPTVTGLSVASTPAAAGAYAAGETIRVEVTFSEALDVAIHSGDSISLALKVGSADRTATCAAHGSDDTKLACSYTVASGDADAGGVSVDAGSLTLGGNAAVQDLLGHAAVLSHGGLAAQSGHKVDTAAPGVEFPTTAPREGTASTIKLTDAVAKVKKYGAVAVEGTATDATGCDAASEIATDDLTTLETPAAARDFSYTPAAGSAGQKVCVYAEDAAGNGGGSLWTTAIEADATAPTVTAGATGYYGDAAATTALTGPVKAGVDIYTKVTFSEDMKHVKGDDAAARPELFYRIGTTDTQYDILDHGDTLASGDCKPSHASETDEYVCRYTVGGSDSGAFTVKVGTNSADKADNALAAAYTHATALTLDTTAPTVTAGSTGYYGDAALGTALSGPLKSGTDVYTKVTFSEDMKHVKGDEEAARPELFRRLGTTDTQYDILNHGDTLASGDCKPNEASDTDVYVCRYTVGGSDNGAFTVKAGTNSVDEANNALAAAYTHSDTLILDTTAPGIEFPSGVTPTVGTASTITLTDGGAKVAKYAVVEVAGTETDATGCDDPSSGGDDFSTTAVSPAASPETVSYEPVTAGKKICVYAEDAAGNSDSELWTTAIAAKPVVTLELGSSTIQESGAGNATEVKARLDKAAGSETVVTLSAAPAGTVVFGAATLTIPANGTESPTVTVTAVDNDVDAADAAVTVSGAVSGTAVAGPADVTLTVTDDDASPVFTGSPETSRSVAENTAATAAVGAAFAATDADSGDTVSYALEGVDAGLFAIGASDGVLKFKASPDYENPGDDGSDNGYEVTVKASDQHGNAVTLAVTVTVTNVEEAGSVTFGAETPAVGVAFTASVDDPDGSVSAVSWQWSRSDTEDGTYADLSGATSASYTPVGDDAGKWLRASASYTDGHGSGKSAAAQASNAVSDPRPKVTLELGSSTIQESGAGNATEVTARLDKAAGSETVVTVSASAVAPAEDGAFSLSANKVLTIAANATASTGTVTITAVDNDVDAADAAVTVSGSVTNTAVAGPADVTLTIADDDASPVFTGSPETARSVAENTAATAAVGAAFAATDADSGDTVSYALEGTDAGLFAIGASDGVLKFKAPPDYEAPGDDDGDNDYAVTVKASDQHGNAVTLAVTVTVTNVEEAGSVTFGAETPAVGVAFTATLADPDGSVSAVSWQWARSDTEDGTYANLSGATSASYTPVGDDAGKWLRASASYTDGHGSGKSAAAQASNAVSDPRPKVTLELGSSTIQESGTDNATEVTARLDKAAGSETVVTVSASAVAPAEDGAFSLSANKVLTIAANATASTGTVTITAVDNDVDAADAAVTVSGSVSGTAVVGPADVTLTIADDDASPVFAAGTVTARSVAENTAATAAVGAAFAATDADSGDTVSYALEGTDAGLFAIGASDGVLKFKAPPDYEAPGDDDGDNDYAVTVKASDQHGNAVTLAVTVTVTNVEEAGSVTFGAETPAVGVAFTATLADPDGSVSAVSWQWARSDTEDGTYTDLSGATSASYTPVGDDAGKWLRASASYTDGHGSGKSAAAQASNAVSDPRPKVTLELGSSTIQESGTDNATTVTATLDKAAGSETVVTVSASAVAPAEDGAFSLSANKMLTIAANATASTGTVTITAVDNDVDAADAAVTVSGSVSGTAVAGPADVTLTIADDDASPVFAAGTVTARSVAENTAATAAVGAAFAATDADAGDTVSYALEGTDAGLFAIGASDGVLKFKASPDYENPGDDGSDNGYEVTVKASDQHGNAVTLAVTVTVTNVEEAGSVTFGAETPAVGVAFTATLADPDGGIDALTWTWESSADRSTWAAATGTVSSSGVESSYTPVASDVGKWLRASAGYTDGHGSGKSAAAQASNAVSDPRPKVTGALAITSDPGDDDVYSTGEALKVTVTFDKAIVVTGTPQLTIRVGSADRTASCAAHATDTKKLVCTYTVAAGDADTDGVSVAANQLSLPAGASIKDASDVAATLTHDALAAQSGHKVGAPTVPSSWGVGLSVSPTTLKDTDFTGSPGTKEVTLTLSGENDAEDSLVWAGADPDGGLNARGVFQRDGMRGDFFATTKGLGYFTLSGGPSGLTITKVRMTTTSGSRPAYVTLSLSGTLSQSSYTVTLTVNHNVLSWEDSGATCSDIEGTGNRQGRRPSYDPTLCPASLSATFTLQKGTTTNSAATGKPSITGTATAGQTVTAAKGTIADANGVTKADAADTGFAYTYQWIRVDSDGSSNAADISGATSSTYTLAAADVGKKVKVRVSFKDDAGNAESRTSDAWPPSATIAAKPVVTLELGSSTIAESGTDNATEVTARLDKAAGSETVVTVSASAVAPAEDGAFSLSANKVLTIAANATASTGTVTITAVDNDVDAADAAVTVSGSVSGTAVAGPADVTLTIADDDASPVFTGSPETSRSVAENTAATAAVGAAFAATDADAGDTVSYALEGTDAGLFAIGASDGVLKFKASPDYENPGDDGSDNDYEVTVKASDQHGNAVTLAVTVTVTNVEEAGSVTFGAETPAVGVAFTATLADPDGSVSAVSWQWARSDTEDGTYANLSGATSASYTPVGDDAGKWLRASASYTDGHGSGKSAAAQASNAVSDPRPKVTLELGSSTIQESGTDNATTVTATLDKAAGSETVVTVSASAVAPAEDGAFSLSANKVLTIAANATASTGTVTITAVDNDVDAADAAVTVSGSVTNTAVAGPADVTLTIADDDASPVFTGSPETSRSVAENTAATAAVGAAFAATDADAGDTVSYALEGTDAGLFAIGASDGVLKFKASPDYENPGDDGSDNGYEVTVKASDQHGNAVTLAVTVTVTNVEEAGSVTFGAETPAVGVAFTATLADPDGSVSAVSWQWARSDTEDGTYANLSGATSASYTPVGDDAGKWLRASASYTDGHGSGKSAAAESANAVSDPRPKVTLELGSSTIQESGAGNATTVKATLPSAVSSETVVMLSAAPAGTVVFGAPTVTIPANGTESPTATVTAVDNDVDAADAEVAISGSVTNTAVAGPADVTLTIADDDASPVFAAGTVTARSVAENTAATAAVGAAFAATDADAGDTVSYALEGTDAGLFAIGASDGVLKFKASPDYEAPGDDDGDNDYEVTVKASDQHGNAVTLAVTVTVTNVEEAGSVTFGAETPAVGVAFTASVDDPDGSVSAVSWQWARSDTEDGTYADLSGATSASYTPVGDDAGKWLRASASYTDGHGSGKSAAAQASNAVSDPRPKVTLELGSSTIQESGTDNATEVTARLDKAAGSETVVTVSASAVAPAEDGAFSLSANKVLTIAANATASTGTVTITAVDNDVDAADAAVTVSGCGERHGGGPLRGGGSGGRDADDRRRRCEPGVHR